AALAGALGVRRRALTLRSGARSREKLVEVAVDDPERRSVEARLAALLAAGAGTDQPPGCSSTLV
ncbi:MAG: hypothetical protein ACYC0E_12590, partial [Acidimicrobiales bacterium]